MSEDPKRQLEYQLWGIANLLRGNENDNPLMKMIKCITPIL